MVLLRYEHSGEAHRGATALRMGDCRARLAHEGHPHGLRPE